MDRWMDGWMDGGCRENVVSARSMVLDETKADSESAPCHSKRGSTTIVPSHINYFVKYSIFYSFSST